MLKPHHNGTCIIFETPDVKEATVIRMETTAGIAWYEWHPDGWIIVPGAPFQKFEAEYQQQLKEKQND